MKNEKKTENLSERTWKLTEKNTFTKKDWEKYLKKMERFSKLGR